MATTEVGRFLVDLGADLGRTPQQMQPIVAKLVEENWYETLSSLQDVTEEEWARLNIPGRLVAAIRAKLKRTQPQQASEMTGTPVQRNDVMPVDDESVPRAVLLQKEEPDFRTEFAPPEGMQFPYELDTAMDALCVALDGDELEVTIGTLAKLIGGMLADPSDSKKRRIREGNELFHQRVGRHPTAVAVLESVGFVRRKGEGVLELPVAYLGRLTDAHNLLVAAGGKRGIVVPSISQYGKNQPARFNPYASSFVATTADYIKVGEKRGNETEQVQQELRSIRHALKTAGDDETVPLNPRAFHISQMGKVEDAVAQLRSEPDDEDKEGVPSGVDLIKLKQALSDGPQFRSRAKQELTKLRKQKVFSRVIFRVQFEDKMVLELQFRASEKLKDVEAAIRPFLRQEVRNLSWYIYESPPVRRFDPEKTLCEEKLYPAVMVHFGYPRDGHFPKAPHLDTSLLPRS